MLSIKVSANELNALLKRAFESLGFAQGEYEDAAAMTLWLELRGLYGLLAARNAWPALSRIAPLAVETQSPERCVLAADGASVLRVGAAAVDLVCANGALAERACVIVRNCRDRIAILQRLACATPRGRPLLATWHDAQHAHLVRFCDGGGEPDYARYAAIARGGQDHQTLSLICAPAVTLEGESAAWLAAHGPPIEHVGAGAFAYAREAALEDGLSIEARHWRFFTRAADAVLVAGTAQSRRGAGE